MKVLLVTESLGSGGAERQLTALAALMAAEGHYCIVVTWVDKNFYATYLAENNVQHILIESKGRFDRVRKLVSVFRNESPDAVISYLPSANETCALASLFCPVKLIVSERSFTINWGLRRKFTNLLYRRAAYIVANSNNEAENIRHHCAALAHKVVAIPNFVDTQMFKPSAKTFDRSRHKIVGVGRVIPTKNLLNLVKAMAKVKASGFDFELKWYGDTYDKVYLKELVSLICREGLAADFMIMGESHDISSAYADADCFVMPSVLEGYPNVLVEAMASGLPVAVSNVCEHPYIVTEGKNGFLFNPESVDEITEAVINLFQLSKDDYERISVNNRTAVIENNSAETFLQHYIQLLD